MTVGERIKTIRISKGMTQKDLADILGISFVNISQWERGRTEPKLETLEKIAKALGVTPLYLIGLDIKKNGLEISSEEELQKQQIIAWELYQQLNDPAFKLLQAFKALNAIGQQKAVDYLEDLTDIPKYRDEYIEDGK